MLTPKVLKQTPQIDDEEMVLLYPRKNVGQLRVKPARYLKKIIYFFQHCNLPKWNRVSTYWNSENCLWHEFADLQDTQTQGNHLLSSVHNAEVALTLVHLIINTMKNKKEEFKTIFVHFLWTKAEQSWRSMYLATIKHRQFAKGTSDPRLWVLWLS